jgi:hypothetical protein
MRIPATLAHAADRTLRLSIGTDVLVASMRDSFVAWGVRTCRTESPNLAMRDDLPWDELARAGLVFLVERAWLEKLISYTELNAT